MSSAVLEAVDVGVKFDAVYALRGANLSVGKGEVVVVMGPSGSGKSTILHCLAGLLEPSSGSVRFNGLDLSELDDGELAEHRLRNCGFVFQFGHLLPELTALDNVALPLRLLGSSKKDARQSGKDILGQLGLASEADRSPSKLSGGQFQRVAVARALVSRPAAIFADEPTGALDSASAATVMSHLIDGARSTDAAVVIVTHDPAIAGLADRVVMFSDGAEVRE